MSKSNKNKRKLNNWLLDFSYRRTVLFFLVVLFLCAVSVVVPVKCAEAAPVSPAICACGCTTAELPDPSAWECVASWLTGLINALAIASVAIGIYSVAEAKAGAEENAETGGRIKGIDSEMKEVVLPGINVLQKDMRFMILQMEDLQNGLNRTRSRVEDLAVRKQIDFSESRCKKEGAESDGGPEIDESDV